MIDEQMTLHYTDGIGMADRIYGFCILISCERYLDEWKAYLQLSVDLFNNRSFLDYCNFRREGKCGGVDGRG